MDRSLAIVGLFVACTSARPPGPDAAIGPDATAYPAFHPSMPQVKPAGRPPLVLANPTIQVVYFANETAQATYDPVLADYVASAVFSSELAEYSVRSATLAPPLTLAATAPPTVPETAVDAFITSELDGTHAEIGAVDSATLAAKEFILIYPAASMVTVSGVDMCTSGATGYHRDDVLASGARAQVGVVPTCDAGAGVIAGATYAMVAIATDPLVALQPQGWAGFGGAIAQPAAFGGELDTVCADAPAMIDGYNVAKIWSNAAAAAYHDPCAPADPSPYFVAVPIATDPVGTGLGVTVPVGSYTTVALDLISDGPTSAAWRLGATAVGDLTATFSFDSPTGQNGDVRHVIVGAQAATSGVVDITSTLGGVTHTWPLAVQAQ